jgi:hypothetical protein
MRFRRFAKPSFFGLTVLLVAATVLAFQREPAKASIRPYSAGVFALDLDGAIVGFLRSVEGGFPKANIVVNDRTPDNVTKKHVANIRYEDITIQVLPTASKSLFDWINQTWQGKPARKNGSIASGSYDRKELSRVDFTNALITETTIPAMDSALKEPGFLTVKFSPEHTQMRSGSGALLAGPATTSKVWLPSNFRLEIGGLDCSRVSKVDSFTIKMTTAQDNIGRVREATKVPGKLEIPNLVFYVPEVFAKSFYDLQNSFLLGGKNGDAQELNGKLYLLDQTRTGVLLQIGLNNLGLVSVSPEKAEANSDLVRRVRVEMYCERMDLSTSGK